MLRTGKIPHLYGTTIIDEVTGAVNKAGLTVKNVYNAFTKDIPDDKSERLYFVIEK